MSERLQIHKCSNSTTYPLVSNKSKLIDKNRKPLVSGPPLIQTKLTVNQPGDKYEQEADRVAEQVMRMQGPVLQRKCTKCNKNKENTLQAKESPGQLPLTQDQDLNPIVQDVLNSPGQPLDPAIRDYMEPRFGYDFSRVRVHAGPTAEQSVREVNANAYTLGNNIVFGAGKFTPGTYEGKQLIAHELTHVVQQSGSNGTHIKSYPTLRRQAPGSSGPAKGQMGEIGLRQLALLPHQALKQWRVLTQSERDQVLWNMQLIYGAPFTSEFLKYASGVKKPNPGLAGTLKGPQYTPKWLFDRGYRHAYGKIWVRPSGEYLMVLPPGQTESEEEPTEKPKDKPDTTSKAAKDADKEKPTEKPEDTYEYGGVTYYKSGKVASYPKSMESRCMLVCLNDTKNEEECSDCCVEKIPASDNGCLNFCIASCQGYYE